MKARKITPALVLCALLFAIFLFCSIYPLFQVILISLKSTREFTLNATGLPTTLQFSNFSTAWQKGNFSQLFLNSVIITVVTVVLSVALASPAGFALSKLKPKGARAIYYYFILGMIIPVQVIMISLIKMGQATHLNNTLLFMIFIFTATGISFPLIIYTSFYKGLPMNVIEAAKIDGCNTFQLFTRIVFPLTNSVNATVAIIAGMYPWKDLFVPLVFGDSDNLRTLTVGLMHFSSSYFTDWPTIFAGVIIISLPIVLIYLAMQRYFIEGITAGAVKG